MIDTQEINKKVEKLDAALREKLRLRGRTFAARVRKAGRLLPKRVHRAADTITQIQMRATHPKLSRLNDPVVFKRAVAVIHDHLDTVDPAERRKDRILGILGGLVFNLIVLIAAALMLMRWKGVI